MMSSLAHIESKEKFCNSRQAITTQNYHPKIQILIREKFDKAIKFVNICRNVYYQNESLLVGQTTKILHGNI